MTGSLIGCLRECSISGWFVHNKLYQTAVDSPYFGEAGNLIKTPILCKNAINFVCFFVLRKWMFCKWDVPIVPCVSFQNALFCGPRGLTFTWWGRCGLRFWYKPTELAHSFFFCSFVYFLCLYDPFNCISFHKLSRQLSPFSLCSSSLVSYWSF